MGASVLMTKLHMPVVSRKLVPRSRLLARLADGLTRPLTLVSAPPGFGKTTLLAEWISNFKFQISDSAASNLQFC